MLDNLVSNIIVFFLFSENHHFWLRRYQMNSLMDVVPPMGARTSSQAPAQAPHTTPFFLVMDLSDEFV
jgi:hypothetical protein